MTEADLQKKIVGYLRKPPDTFAVKIHGGPHQAAGLPDIVCCYGGLFIGFEVKLPGKEKTLTPKQELKLRRIVESGGKAAMVTSIEQVQEVLEETWE